MGHTIRVVPPWVVGAIGGAAITLASMVVSYEFCMDGLGRGLPFAVIHPSHDEGEWAVPLYDTSKYQYGQELDLLRSAADCMFWGALLFWLARRWRRQATSV